MPANPEHLEKQTTMTDLMPTEGQQKLSMSIHCKSFCDSITTFTLQHKAFFLSCNMKSLQVYTGSFLGTMLAIIYL